MIKQPLKRLSLLCAIALSIPLSPVINPAIAQGESTTEQQQRAAVKLLQAGEFQDGAHPTKGLARLLEYRGKNYLLLSENFKSDSGPDLFVLLHQSENPSSYETEEYVNLGRLTQVEGRQAFRIPDSVTDLSQYQSVVVWCREFNVTFGHATLKSQ